MRTSEYSAVLDTLDEIAQCFNPYTNIDYGLFEMNRGLIAKFGDMTAALVRLDNILRREYKHE